MAMRAMLLAMLLSLAPWAAAAEGVPKQVHLVSEEWLDYTNADGTGVAGTCCARCSSRPGSRW